jgi:hypothetical protein
MHGLKRADELPSMMSSQPYYGPHTALFGRMPGRGRYSGRFTRESLSVLCLHWTWPSQQTCNPTSFVQLLFHLLLTSFYLLHLTVLLHMASSSSSPSFRIIYKRDVVAPCGLSRTRTLSKLPKLRPASNHRQSFSLLSTASVPCICMPALFDTVNSTCHDTP